VVSTKCAVGQHFHTRIGAVGVLAHSSSTAPGTAPHGRPSRSSKSAHPRHPVAARDRFERVVSAEGNQQPAIRRVAGPRGDPRSARSGKFHLGRPRSRPSSCGNDQMRILPPRVLPQQHGQRPAVRGTDHARLAQVHRPTTRTNSRGALQVESATIGPIPPDTRRNSHGLRRHRVLIG
jgi:hypothetical protein